MFGLVSLVGLDVFTAAMLGGGTAAVFTRLSADSFAERRGWSGVGNAAVAGAMLIYAVRMFAALAA